MNSQTPPPIERLHERIGRLHQQQIAIWQKMSPAERLDIAFQAYQLALETVRLTERQRHPDLSEDDFNWRVTRRLQGHQRLGKKFDLEPDNLRVVFSLSSNRFTKQPDKKLMTPDHYLTE